MDYCYIRKFNINIILKPYECRDHLQFLQNYAGYINIKALTIKSENTKSPLVLFFLNCSLDLISVFHFIFCILFSPKRVLFGLLLPLTSD